jgi:hypothetical protein
MRQAIRDLERTLVISRVGQACAFAFIPSTWIPADRLTIFASSNISFFAVLQSRIHEVWARFFSTTLKDDLIYTPSACFETFPFPERYELHSALACAGNRYYEFRAALMVKNREGLTKTYNRFHDPNETSPDVVHLRELHYAIDRAVLDAYGWTDMQPTCEFLLDYEEEDGEDSRRKKPWRYRWPDDIRDEILAWLLALNTQRTEEERLAGAASGRRRSGKKPSRRIKRIAGPQASLEAAKPEE